MNSRKSRQAALVLAALLVGTVIGYVYSEAARNGNPLVQVPTAQAGEVKVSKAPLKASQPKKKAPAKAKKAVQAKAKKPGKKAPAKAKKPEKKVQRFGQVIGLKSEKQTIYNMLHAHPWKPINQMIKSCNIQNYSIYETELGGKLYLFAYFEYTGSNFRADMAKMGKDSITRAWWKLTDPCQIRLPGTPKGEQWKAADEVYHLD